MPLARAADYVWLEGETPSFINVKPNISGWGRKEFLSQEKWLQVSMEAGNVDKELPAEGGLLRYDFNIVKEGGYEIWNRIGYEFVRSPFDWRIDGDDWTRVGPEQLTTDLMELQAWNEVAWLKLGEKHLTAGAHKLEIRMPKTKDEKGNTARLLYASDAICIHSGPFYPNSKCKPDEDYRDATDLEAEKKVFGLPPATSSGARRSVRLEGLWQVCRHDEQTPGEVAKPITDFPAQPHWKALQVPGNKNSLRPDLIFAHRLWYRTRVNVPASLTGHSFFMVFPQNNLNTTVFVNGVYCGFNKNPFSRFSIDVTKGVKPGLNEVWVGIKDAYYGYSTNPKDPMKLRRKFNFPVTWTGNGWQDLAYPVWNHFESGLLQTPEFVVAGSVYASDVFCKPSVGRRELAVEVTLLNPTAKDASGEAQWEAVNPKTGAVEKSSAAKAFTLAAGTDQVLQLVDKWDNPKLWWPEDPNLYRLRVTIKVAGTVVDLSETPFGFREWSWSGRDFKLNGIVWHGWADCFTAANKEDWLANYRKLNQRMMRFWGPGWQGMGPDEALDFFDRNGVIVRRTGMLDGEAIGYFAVENDPDLRKLSGTDIKMELLNNWKDQVVAWVKGERNHPSIMIWSLENEFLYINCINLYGHLMDQFEKVTTDVSNAVMTVDPTRPTMVDGGGACKANTLPVHGDHYVVGAPQQYPDLAYQTNPKGGGRGRWEWDEKRPRFLGEDFYMTGNHPEVSYFQGEEAFSGKPVKGVALWERILHEGYRWAGYGAWHLWLGQYDTDQSQYIAMSPLAVLCRQWDWTFESGQKVTRTFGLFNDTHYDDPITFTWTLKVGGKKVTSKSKEYSVPPGTNRKFDEILPLPVVSSRQEGELILSLAVKGTEVFRDVKAVSVLKPAARTPAPIPAKNLIVFDPQGAVSTFLRNHAMPFTAIRGLEELPAAGKVLIVGKDALDAKESTGSRLSAYAAGDRRVIVLEQTNPLRYQGLPAEMESAANGGRTAFGEDLQHPVLQGLRQKDFFTWGADTLVYRNAYAKPGRGAKSLVQCDDNLRYTALAEVPVSNGLMLLCQLNVGERLETNVAAKQLLLNMIGYAATYELEFHQVSAAVNDNPQVLKALDAIGLQYTKADDPLKALDSPGVKTAITSASPANLKTLADNLTRVNAFNTKGGTILLCGLTPEGITDYNKIVGVDHMIRPGKRERVLFPPVRDKLMSGLTTGDIVLYSSQRIFPWTEGNYVVSDMFSHVVDYDEVASFGKSPFWAYDNITNGFVSADGWPLIINFPINKDNSPFDVNITLQKPQTLTEFTWIGNTFYYPQNRVNLIFDGNKDQTVSFKVQPNAEPQTFAIDPPRTASTITLQIAEWTVLPNVAPNIGIDNIYWKAKRPPEFYTNVKQMLNIGGLMHYVKGPGNIVLCNLNFKDNEEVPENVVKKRTILATILRNLKAPFAGGKTIIAGAGLQYQTIDLSKHATQYRDEKGWFGDKAFSFKDMPTGKQAFAGVPFQVYEFPTSPVPTVLMLAGAGIPNNPPTEIRGLPVNRKADALFFLQAARLDVRRNDQEVREKKEYEMLRYLVTYTDGQTVSIPIHAEIDIDDYKQKTATPLPGAQIAWIRPYEGTEFSAVAYCKQWNNPRPEVEIKSIDMVYGNDRRGVAALIAVTAAIAAK